MSCLLGVQRRCVALFSEVLAVRREEAGAGPDAGQLISLPKAHGVFIEMVHSCAPKGKQEGRMSRHDKPAAEKTRAVMEKIPQFPLTLR